MVDQLLCLYVSLNNAGPSRSAEQAPPNGGMLNLCRRNRVKFSFQMRSRNSKLFDCMPDIPTTVPLVTEQLTARSRDLFGNALLSIVGILLPLAGGFLAGWPWYRMGYVGDFIPPLPFWGTVLSLVVGAALLRSWWAVLIVPVVWSAGATLAGYILQPFLWGWDCTSITNITCPGAYSPGWSAVQAMLGSGLLWRGLGFILLPLLACATLGAGIGVALSNWLKKPRQPT
jgi:hypothetical protein